MAAKVLTIEAAKAAKIEVIENGKYSQVVHDTVVALRANRRSGTASVKTKATVNGSGSKPMAPEGTQAAPARRLQVEPRVGWWRRGFRRASAWDYSKKVAKSVKKLALHARR